MLNEPKVKYSKKRRHTSPEFAGKQNMTLEAMKNMSDKKKQKVDSKTNIENAKILQLRKMRAEQLKRDRQPGVSKWDAESLEKSISEFFDWCTEESVLPSKPLLAIWLCVHGDTLRSWLNNSNDEKGEVLKSAYTVMEAMYFNDLDSHTVSNMFRLKTQHAYVESSRLDINNTKVQEQIDISQTIANLGLPVPNNNDK